MGFPNMAPYSLLSALLPLALLNSVAAHVIMVEPHPYNLDTEPLYQNWPLSADLPFPCQGRYQHAEYTTTMEAGTTQKVRFWGSAVHGGGSCQFSVAYGDTPPDDPSAWKTIYSLIGGCPAEAQGNIPTTESDPHGRLDGPQCGNDSGTECVREFNIPIPKDMMNGPAVFAWTWFNKIGNREMYMTCAPVIIAGGRPAGDSSFVDDLPAIFRANIPGTCTTGPSGSLISFPEPGRFGKVQEDPTPGSEGSCEPGIVPIFEDEEEGPSTVSPSESEESVPTSTSVTTPPVVYPLQAQESLATDEAPVVIPFLTDDSFPGDEVSSTSTSTSTTSTTSFEVSSTPVEEILPTSSPDTLPQESSVAEETLAPTDAPVVEPFLPDESSTVEELPSTTSTSLVSSSLSEESSTAEEETLSTTSLPTVISEAPSSASSSPVAEETSTTDASQVEPFLPEESSSVEETSSTSSLSSVSSVSSEEASSPVGETSSATPSPVSSVSSTGSSTTTEETSSTSLSPVSQAPTVEPESTSETEPPVTPSALPDPQPEPPCPEEPNPIQEEETSSTSLSPVSQASPVEPELTSETEQPEPPCPEEPNPVQVEETSSTSLSPVSQDSPVEPESTSETQSPVTPSALPDPQPEPPCPEELNPIQVETTIITTTTTTTIITRPPPPPPTPTTLVQVPSPAPEKKTCDSHPAENDSDPQQNERPSWAEGLPACPEGTASGELVCLDETTFGICNQGWVFEQFLEDGRICKDGIIVIVF